jgi:hypothetical protein
MYIVLLFFGDTASYCACVPVHIVGIPSNFALSAELINPADVDDALLGLLNRSS